MAQERFGISFLRTICTLTEYFFFGIKITSAWKLSLFSDISMFCLYTENARLLTFKRSLGACDIAIWCPFTYTMRDLSRPSISEFASRNFDTLS